MPRVIMMLYAVLLSLAGCATLPPRSGFDQVQELASERLGKRVHWNQGTAEDGQAGEAVGRLLARELGPDEAVQVALLNNRNLQAVYEELGLAQAQLIRAGLLSNPVFDAEVRLFDAGKGKGTGLELTLVQDFLDVLVLPLRRRLAEAAFESARYRVAGKVLELAGEVRASFYNLQAAEQELEMRRTVLEATRASNELAGRLREAGNTTALDRAGERALYEQAKLDVVAAEAQAIAERERLTTLMGVWGHETQWKAATRLAEPPAEELSLEKLEGRAVARSLDLAEARSGIVLAARQLGLTRPLALLSGAEFGATYEREPEGEWGIGPAFSLPLPFFNRGQAEAAAARALLRGSRERYAALAVEIRAAVRTARSRLLAGRARAEHYRTVLLPLRRQIVTETQKQYNAMQLGAFHLLQAKQQEIDAGRDYIRALGDYWLSRTALETILSGKLPRMDLAASAEQPEGEARAPGGESGGDRGDD